MTDNSPRARRERRRMSRRQQAQPDRKAQAPVLEDNDRRPAGAQRPAPQRAEQRLRSRPANENETGPGAALANARRAVSTAPFWFAFAFSLIWVFAVSALFGPTLLADGGLLASKNLTSLVAAGMGLALPILLVWTTAYLLWRAQQMRQVSEALVSAAMRLVRPQEVVGEGLTSIAQSVRQEVDMLVGGIEHAVRRASELEGVVHREMANIERAFGANEERIRTLLAGLEGQREALQQAGAMMGADTEPVLARLEEYTANLGQVVGTASTTLSALEHGLKETTVGLTQTIDEVASRATSASSEVVNQTSRMEQLSGALVGELQAFTHNLAGQLDTLSSSVSSINNEGSQFGNHIRSLETSLVTTLRSSAEELTKVASESGDTIGQIASSLTGQMEETRKQLSQDVRATGSLVAEEVRGVTTQVIDEVRLAGSGVTEELRAAGSGVTDELRTSAIQVQDEMRTAAADLAQAIVAATGESAGELLSATAKTGEEIRTSTDRLENLLKSTSESITYHVKSTSAEVVQQMERSGVEVAENIEKSGEGLQERLMSVSGDFVVKVGEAREALFGYLEEASSEMTAKLADNASRISAEIDTTSRTLTDRLAQTSMNITELLDQTSSAMLTRIETSSRDLGERFDAANNLLEEVSTQLTSRLDQTGARFVERIDGSSERIIADLNRAGEAFADNLGSARADIVAGLTKASSGMAEEIDEATQRITGRFEQATGVLLQRIDNAANDFDEHSEATARKLDAAGIKFADHVKNANALLGDTLSSAALGLDEELESVSTALTDKLEKTSETISTRLREASTVVEKSIIRFNTHIEDVLHNREDLLTALSDELSAKAAEVDKMMRGYITLVENSLSSVHERSEEIGRMIAAQASAAAENLREEIQRLEATSDKQIATAARTLREQHEVVMKAMNALMTETSGEFMETAREMQTVAQEVAREIDEARKELQNAIYDLPEETRDNADAMRRVISDQITALSALSDVVKRQAASLEVSGSNGNYLPGGRGASPGKSEGVGFAVPHTADTGARNTANRRRASTRHDGPSDTVHGRPVDDILKARAPRGSSNLLDHVDSAVDEAPQGRSTSSLSRATQRQIAKLNASTRDLLEALDGELPGDLEKRYRAGERHVYTHRLYRRRNARFIDNLRQRYGDEQIVRGRMDAFIALFEDLLDMVSEDANGEAMVDACLASETGKLYIAVAQAAGRIAA